MPLISVVILTADRREALARCLRSLGAQAAGGCPGRDGPCAPGSGHLAFEVIVVDNGSTDGTRAMLAEQRWVPTLRVVEGDAGASFAEARNRGAAAAAGSLIAFLDDDCEAGPGWLAAIEAALAEADAVGGLCLPPDTLRFPWWWDPGMNWTVGLTGPEHLEPALAGSLAYPQTANFALRREVWRREPFQAIGGQLDGSVEIYRWGREDAELWRRLRLKGFRTRFEPRLVVRHHIDPARLRWRYVLRRARLDGRSLWHREHDPTYLDVALGDLLAWPGRALRALLAPPRRWVPRWRLTVLWRKRQAAFVAACLGERGLKASARPVARVVAGWASGWAKRLVRRPLWLLGRLARRSLWKRLPAAPRHVAVACQGFLGDTVLISPLLDTLRRSWPGARLTLVTNRHGRELHGANPRLDEVIEISPPRFLFGWERWKEIRRTLRRLAPDLVIVPYWHHAPAWPLLISHRAPTVGFDRDMGFRRRLWYDLLDRRAAKDFERHEVENLLALARRAGATAAAPGDLCLPPLPAPSPHISAFLAEHALAARPFFALHIDAVGDGKAWPDARWGVLAARLEAQHPEIPVVFVGLARLRPRVHRLIEDHRLRAIDACANRPLADLAALLRAATLLVTTDSGPAHLARAVGTPTVTLFGNSSPARWGAWEARERHLHVVSPGWDLRPEELGPRGPAHKMALISVEQVEQAVEAALAP